MSRGKWWDLSQCTGEIKTDRSQGNTGKGEMYHDVCKLFLDGVHRGTTERS